MRYAADYRRHLWLDQAQSLRGIDVGLNQLFPESMDDLKAYKEPAETDPRVLGGMAAALANGRLSRGSALRELAIHHLTMAWREGRALGLRANLDKVDSALKADLAAAMGV